MLRFSYQFQSETCPIWIAADALEGDATRMSGCQPYRKEKQVDVDAHDNFRNLLSCVIWYLSQADVLRSCVRR